MTLAPAPTDAVLESGRLRRALGFFPSGDDRLYASLHASTRPGPRVAAVLCQSWGHDTNRRVALRAFARRIAQRGGALLTFDWPGHGDSSGHIDQVDLHRMAEAVVDAIAYAQRIAPEFQWGLAGMGLGAAAAALASARVDVPLLLLIEPALDPSGYRQHTARAARRGALGDSDEGWAFGYPLPPDGDAAEVSRALAGFGGRRAIIRYAGRSGSGDAGIETIVVKRPRRNARRRKHARLLRVAGDWLMRR